MTIILDSDYPNLAAALAAAAGGVLLVTQAHAISGAQVVPAATIVRGSGGSITADDNTYNALEVGGDNVTIEGLRLIGPAIGTPSPGNVSAGNAIYAQDRRNLTVSGCSISDFSSMGIMLIRCSDFTIEKNRLWSNLYTFGDTADICLYSSADAGRGVISGNFCLSNNSQGIFVNALGHDSDLTIAHNVCLATDNGGEEASVVARRHGIMTGYGQSAGGGRINVIGNVIRNTGSTGIYVPSNPSLARAISIVGNTISKVGLTTVQGSLNGGITVAGGGAGAVIANNTIHDYRGQLGSGTGAITITTSIVGSTGLITGNTIDGSSANGIALADASSGWVIRSNTLLGIAGRDIFESPGGNAGGHVIEDNHIVRSNDDYPSIYVSYGSSTKRTTIRRNHMVGYGHGGGPENAAIFLENTSQDKVVVVADNRIQNYRYGVELAQPISSRLFSVLYVDDNHFIDCYYGIVAYDYTNTGVLPVEGNCFQNCANPISGGGGYSTAYEARRDSQRIVLVGLNAAPAGGTWAIGDRSDFSAPTAGPSGSICTAAGSPGTWNGYGDLVTPPPP